MAYVMTQSVKRTIQHLKFDWVINIKLERICEKKKNCLWSCWWWSWYRPKYKKRSLAAKPLTVNIMRYWLPQLFGAGRSGSATDPRASGSQVEHWPGVKYWRDRNFSCFGSVFSDREQGNMFKYVMIFFHIQPIYLSPQLFFQFCIKIKFYIF